VVVGGGGGHIENQVVHVIIAMMKGLVMVSN